MSPFRYLLYLSLGRQASPEKSLSGKDWEHLLSMARFQSLVGVLYEGILCLPKDRKPPEAVLSEWTRLAGLVAGLHSLQERRAEELGERLGTLGMDGYLLKGTGLSHLYPVPERRMGGDIDVWIPEPRSKTLARLRNGGIPVDGILYQECKAAFFKDTIVEVHFHPTKMYNPFLNARLQRFLRKSIRTESFSETPDRHLMVPGAAFNAVFCMAHMLRHYLEGGIGLRQMLDYHYVLLALNPGARKGVMKELSRLGMGPFAGAVMHLLQYSFGLEDGYLLCPPDEKRGEKLVRDCVRMGNFGKGDPRNRARQEETRLGRFFRKNRRVFSNLRYYPREVVWSPFARIGQYCWRLFNGYLTP